MPDAKIYPYVIAPKEVPAIWGGDALVSRYGKPGRPGEKLGESWECWDDNRVSNGPLAGKKIAQLRAKLGEQLLGTIDPKRIFPILTKIIDARASLSVQVHPDDAYAQRVEGQPNGKTECWYILAAEPGAELILGWLRDTDREEYRRRVADGSLAELLRRVPVKPGDVFYLPAGTLHAIGAGIQLFETQQASDLTYRIFDWNRTGADGKPRELHVEKAADVLDFRASTAGAMHALTYRLHGLERTALIADRRFGVERIATTIHDGRIELDGMPLILMALDAPVELGWKGGEERLAPYSTALVPAALDMVFVRAPERAQMLAVAPPCRPQAYAERFAYAGVGGFDATRFLEQFDGR